VNKLVFLRYKEDLKGYKLCDPKNKEFISSKHVTLNEASMVKPIVSQQVEKMKTKSEVSQRVEVDSTPYYPVGSISSEIPSVVTPGGDRVADIDMSMLKKMIQMQLEEPKGNREGGL